MVKILVELKDKRYVIHSNGKNLIALRDPSKSSRTQNQLQNETDFKKKSEFYKFQNPYLEVERYPKKEKANLEKPKFNLPDFPNCRHNIWVA